MELAITKMLDAHKIKLKRLFNPKTVGFKRLTMTKKAKATPSEKKMEDMVIREAVKFALQLALKGDRVNRRPAVPMQTRRNKMRIEDERRRKRRKMAGLPELPTGGVARIADIQKRDVTKGFGSRTAGDRMFMGYKADMPGYRARQQLNAWGGPSKKRPMQLSKLEEKAPISKIDPRSVARPPEGDFWRKAYSEASKIRRGMSLPERERFPAFKKYAQETPEYMKRLQPLRKEMGLAPLDVSRPEISKERRVPGWMLDAYDPLITVEGGKERFKFGTGPMEGYEFRPEDIKASRTPAEHQGIVKNWMARPSEARAKLPDTFNIPGEGHMRGFDIRPKSPFQGMEIKRLPLPGQLQAEGKGGLTEYQKEIVTLKREKRERETGLKRFESKAKAALTKYLTPIKDESGADTEETGLPSEINQLYLDANSLAQQGKYKEADDFIKKGVAEHETERAETERIMNMPEEERKRYIEMRRKQLLGGEDETELSVVESVAKRRIPQMAETVESLDGMIPSPGMSGIYKKTHPWEGRVKTLGEHRAALTGITQKSQRSDILRKGENEITMALRRVGLGKELFDRNNLRMKLERIYGKYMTEAQIAQAILNGELLGGN
jgi:hypothetical protein